MAQLRAEVDDQGASAVAAEADRARVSAAQRACKRIFAAAVWLLSGTIASVALKLCSWICQVAS